MGTSLTGLTPATTYDALIKVGDNGPIDATLKVLSDGLGNNLPMEASSTTINFTNGLQQSGVAVPTASQVNAKQDTLVSGTNIKTINGTSVLGAGNIVTPSTPPSGVSGAIQFSNGSAFASDASNFFWDNTNKRFGVGTNAPTQTADIFGNVKIASATSGLLIRDYTAFNTFKAFYKASETPSDSNYLIAMDTDVLINSRGSGTDIYYNNSLRARFGNSTSLLLKGSGSTSATTSLLVQNSAGNNALQVTDDQMVRGYNGTGLRFRLGATLAGQSISTRDGELAIGLIDSGQSPALRFLVLGTGSSYIDGYTEGPAKAQNYPLFIGSRANNSVSSVTGSTTQENGMQTIFGSAVSDASALVQINSTTRGFLPPRMTTTQKNAIATPASGLVVYDSTTNKLQCYNGSTWNDLF